MTYNDPGRQIRITNEMRTSFVTECFIDTGQPEDTVLKSEVRSAFANWLSQEHGRYRKGIDNADAGKLYDVLFDNYGHNIEESRDSNGHDMIWGLVMTVPSEPLHTRVPAGEETSQMTYRETVAIPRPKNTKWKKIQPLGEGGQGVTFLVENTEDPDEPRRVLKELRRPGDAQASERFEKEIETIIGLNHPSIIKIVDYSVVHDPQFYVMEYHEGATTLADVILTDHNPYHGNVSKCLELFEKIVFVITECGSLTPPVYHRDISPRNILHFENGDIMFIDFGLAYTDGETHVTQSGERLGAHGYAPPEFGAGRQRSPSVTSDIYSAAKVLWSAMTSQSAFAGETPLDQDKSMRGMFVNHDEALHLNRVFEQTIQKNQSDRVDDGHRLLKIVRSLQQTIREDFPPLELVPYKCPSCGHPRSVQEHYIRDDEIATLFVKNGMLTYICDVCGFVFSRHAKTYRNTLEKHSRQKG